jgi:Spy/CpxP family protein refolding chaperone
VRAVERVGALAGLLALVTAGGTASAATDERSKWWKSESVKAEILLTPEQSQALENIFQATLPTLRAEKEELDRQERLLSQLVREAAVDENRVVELIDGVEAARAQVSKTRTMMLYRMYRTLTPAQREKLKLVHERQKEERRSQAGTSQPD